MMRKGLPSGTPGRLMRACLWAVLGLSVVLGFGSSIGNVRRGAGDADKARVEEAVRRYAVACYATEGIYPPNLEYLEDYYGLQIDEELYTVYYEVFGTNLMPDITVLYTE